MIHSMTGYGIGTISSNNYHISVTIKSLNSKYFESYIKVPYYYFKEELYLKNQLAKEFKRGKLTMNLSVRSTEKSLEGLSGGINTKILMQYYNELIHTCSELDVKQNINIESILSLPNVVKEIEIEVQQKEWELVQEATLIAIHEVHLSRKKEGESILIDLFQQIEILESLLTTIDTLDLKRIETIKERLQSTFKEYHENMTINEDRFQQELLYYLEKIDFNEEKIRLQSHIKSFKEFLETGSEQHGRKLSFILQEMHRETNTLGVKSFHIDIQKKIINMKEILEKMKEQILNIL